jgi:hypothetical protein
MQLAIRIVIFFIYSIVYFFSAVMSTGGGHGNFIFIAPLFSWICPFAAVCLSNRLNNKTVRIIFIALLLLHYFIVGFNVFEYLQSKYWQKDYYIWQNYYYWQIFLIALYFAGQVYIWSFYFRKSNLIREKENIFLHTPK